MLYTIDEVLKEACHRAAINLAEEDCERFKDIPDIETRYLDSVWLGDRIRWDEELGRFTLNNVPIDDGDSIEVFNLYLRSWETLEMRFRCDSFARGWMLSGKPNGEIEGMVARNLQKH